MNQRMESVIGWPGLAIEFWRIEEGQEEKRKFRGRDGVSRAGGERISQSTLCWSLDFYQVFISISNSRVFIILE